MKNNVIKIWIDESAIYIRTIDGEVFSRLFSDFPLLRNATSAQRANFQQGKQGIRWESIDEDLSYEGFFKHVKNSDLNV